MSARTRTSRDRGKHAAPRALTAAIHQAEPERPDGENQSDSASVNTREPQLGARTQRVRCCRLRAPRGTASDWPNGRESAAGGRAPVMMSAPLGPLPPSPSLSPARRRMPAPDCGSSSFMLSAAPCARRSAEPSFGTAAL